MEFSKFGSERISYVPIEVHGKMERLIVRIWTQAQLRQNEELNTITFVGGRLYDNTIVQYFLQMNDY